MYTPDAESPSREAGFLEDNYGGNRLGVKYRDIVEAARNLLQIC
jgi:hypothetical protein